MEEMEEAVTVAISHSSCSLSVISFCTDEVREKKGWKVKKEREGIIVERAEGVVDSCGTLSWKEQSSL